MKQLTFERHPHYGSTKFFLPIQLIDTHVLFNIIITADLTRKVVNGWPPATFFQH